MYIEPTSSQPNQHETIGASPTSQSSVPTKRREPQRVRARAPRISLEQSGRLRASNLLAVLGISHSTLYTGLKIGRYPKPDGRDGKMPFWHTQTIREFLKP